METLCVGWVVRISQEHVWLWEELATINLNKTNATSWSTIAIAGLWGINVLQQHQNTRTIFLQMSHEQVWTNNNHRFITEIAEIQDCMVFSKVHPLWLYNSNPPWGFQPKATYWPPSTTKFEASNDIIVCHSLGGGRLNTTAKGLKSQ